MEPNAPPIPSSPKLRMLWVENRVRTTILATQGGLSVTDATQIQMTTTLGEMGMESFQFADLLMRMRRDGLLLRVTTADISLQTTFGYFVTAVAGWVKIALILEHITTAANLPVTPGLDTELTELFVTAGSADEFFARLAKWYVLPRPLSDLATLATVRQLGKYLHSCVEIETEPEASEPEPSEPEPKPETTADATIYQTRGQETTAIRHTVRLALARATGVDGGQVSMTATLAEMGLAASILPALGETLRINLKLNRLQVVDVNLTIETTGSVMVALIDLEHKRTRINNLITAYTRLASPPASETKLNEIFVESLSFGNFVARLQGLFKIDAPVYIFRLETVDELVVYLLLCEEIEPEAVALASATGSTNAPKE